MKKIGKYQLFAEIHQGPITTLYKAYHTQLDRIVLIKQLNSERIKDYELIERFQQEGLIIAKINHPNIVSIFDYGIHNEVPYLVMEFIEGVTLADLLRERDSIPLTVSLILMHQICSGLFALHQKKFIHRDVKPGNILISNEGNVKIGDFGFAESKLNSSNFIMGTPAYMSPEIVLSQRIDERSDIFSMGAVFYEMLSSENPFYASTPSAIFKKIVNSTPPPLKNLQPNIVSLCFKMLEKDKQQRYDSVKAIIKELEPFIKNIETESLIKYLHHPEHYTETPIETASQIQKLKKERSSLKFVYMLFIAICSILLLIYFLKPFLRIQNIEEPLQSNNRTHVSSSPSLSLTDSTKNSFENSSQVNFKTQSELTVPENDAMAGTNTLRPEVNKAPENSNILKPIQIFITTDPRAQVLVNGDSVGISPVQYEITTIPNNLLLILKSPGLPIINKEIIINDILDTRQHVSLWHEVGYLQISVNPWGEIRIDGDSVDVTPLLHPIILAPGSRLLEIYHPTLKLVTEKIYIEAGDTLKKSITLMK